MRRLATAVPAVVTTVVAVLTLSTGTALAHGPERGSSHAKPAHSRADHGKKHKAHKPKVEPLVTMTGVISDTPTATLGSSSDTATSTITLTVKGGERSLHTATVVLTLDKSTVVRRGDAAATPSDLVLGDHVSVRARRMPDGSWLALRVNACAPPVESREDDD
ncbi:MAG: hypothetical protein JWP11_2731 [Frankiales bacterium]|nr:hypothetical protein [Frankiales bacterium]